MSPCQVGVNLVQKCIFNGRIFFNQTINIPGDYKLMNNYCLYCIILKSLPAKLLAFKVSEIFNQKFSTNQRASIFSFLTGFFEIQKPLKKLRSENDRIIPEFLLLRKES
jgi:hypothetical protein